MNKYISMILIVAMLIITSSISFATDVIEGEQLSAEAIADTVEEVVDTDAINTNFDIKKSVYKIKGEGIDIHIPVKGKDPVITQIDGDESIVMNLPNEISKEKGIITSNGTVVYNSDKNDMAVSVQAIQEKQGEIQLDYVRTLITIENSNAPKQFDFEFNLPEGYRLVKDYDYEDNYDEYDCGQVFIVNDLNETVCTVDPAWAKDANGEKLESYYEIEGSTLRQVICFDENTAFPVVADPTSHPNKTSNYYYTKAGIKKLRDKYTELDASTFYSGIITCAAFYMQPIAGVCSSFVFLNQLYGGYKYTSWNAVYIHFEKNYAKVSVTFRWRNGGKNSAYIKSGQKVTYVTAIPV